jgi:hypothetical protein
MFALNVTTAMKDGDAHSIKRPRQGRVPENPILEHGVTLLSQRHAVKDYFPI